MSDKEAAGPTSPAFLFLGSDLGKEQFWAIPTISSDLRTYRLTSRHKETSWFVSASPERARPTGAVNRRLAFLPEQVTVMVFKLFVLESRLNLMLSGSPVTGM